MKKVTKRSFAAMILVLFVAAGMAVYIFRLIRDGGDWATFYANESVYENGSYARGTVTDRNGKTLFFSDGEVYGYADSADIRKACLHVVGDIDGNIGTGALSAFRSQLVGYSIFNGTTGDGGNVKLSIDADLNVTAYNALAQTGRSGAVLVYNYKTGQILCMVSSPSYDPNYGFNAGDSRYEGAYINRAISSSFVPGSVFKLVTMAAAIENIPDLYSQTFHCSGTLEIDGKTIRCANTEVHGDQTAELALAHSCNCAFAQISLQLGGNLIQQYAKKYGLTTTHKLNGIQTAAGSVESAGSDRYNTAWEGIGQYNDMVVPYSLIRLVGAIANGGVCVEPSILCGESNGKTTLMKASTANALSDMMSYDVEAPGGYGSWRYPGLQMHAKTGTAEFGDGTSHAWFAGFITNADAPLAFVVVVEHGGSGISAASPIANTVLQKAVFG